MEWLVIDTEKNEIIRLKEVKKENLKRSQLEKYLDSFVKYKNKYVIFREEESYGTENNRYNRE